MTIRALGTAAMVLAFPAAALEAQGAAMLESNRKAQAVLDRALLAYGGAKQVRAMSRQFTWVLEGELVHRNQSPSAATSVGTPFTLVLAGDLDADRMRVDRTGSYPGGFNWRNIDVLDSGKTRQANVNPKTVVTTNGADPSNYSGQLERLPQQVLARMDRDRRGLLFSGTVTREGRSYAVIEAPFNAGVIARYSFDQQTSLLMLTERIIEDDYAGDAVVSTRYTGYRTQDGTMLPTEIVQATNGSPTLRVRPTTVILGQAPAESLFTLPPGLTETPRQRQDVSFQPVGPGVYLASGMAGGYRLLVADFGTYLAVVESPNGSEQSGLAIERIAQEFPNKPIRYVVPTHHHDDHAGGLRAFIAVGAIVVTTPGNADVFRRMGAATYTIEPDSQSRVRKPVQFEFVQGRKVLEGGGTRIELVDIGPSPHANEMLIAYVPASRFVFQGDLFNTGLGDPVTSGNLTTVHFADWLSKSGLSVDSLGGTHSAVRSRAQLDSAAANVRKGS